MRCLACNKVLNEVESVRKYTWGEYIDLCEADFQDLDILSLVKDELLGETDATSNLDR